MLATLRKILKDHWEWRDQILGLAIFDLKKRARGAALGWLWIVVKPLVFVGVFWFALEIGLKAGNADPNAHYPYFVWLVSGLIPWFFMQDMLGPGSDVLHRYKYLVNKIKFPLCAISSIYMLATLFISIALFVILMAIYTAYGMEWDIYLIQVPLLLLLMAAFWTVFSIFCSQLSAISKDFGQLIQALRQPLFWLSGIIFNMSLMTKGSFHWAADIMLFNPVTFFATAFRDALCDKVWVWEDPVFFGSFLIVFLITTILMLVAYKKLNEEVPDVL